MSKQIERIRASAAEAKAIIEDLTDLLQSIDPNVPLRVSGRHSLSGLGINVLLGLEAMTCGSACTGCHGCEGGCWGCKGPAQCFEPGSEVINPDPTRAVSSAAEGE